MNSPLDKLIGVLSWLPGIGPKSAQRIAFHVLTMSAQEITSLTQTILDTKQSVGFCPACFNLATASTCSICSDPSRDQRTICLVAEPRDIIAIEKSGRYKGLYHVLGGVLSPLNNIGPDMLRIKELLVRIREMDIAEIIVSLSPSVEGEATMLYLSKLIKPAGINMTRIAYGLPMGSDLEYADEITLIKAFEGRQSI